MAFYLKVHDLTFFVLELFISYFVLFVILNYLRIFEVSTQYRMVFCAFWYCFFMNPQA